MTTILTTGGSGFLGSILTNRLRGTEFSIVDLNHAGKKRTDICQPFDLSVNADVVLHAAGKAHFVPRNKKEEHEFFSINFEGTKNLCKAIEKRKDLPRAFIFISTVAVYGLEEGYNISEDYPLLGKSPYALSKIQAENWLREWTSTLGIRLSILRLPLIAGPKPPGNLNSMIEGIRSGKYLSIGLANARKSIVWAEDIASIIPCVIEKGGIYNLSDDCHPTFGELENTIAIALNKRKPLKVPYWVAKGLAKTGDIVGQRFPINSEKLRKITSTLTFDDSKAKEQLRWRPTPVLSKISDML